MDDDLKIGDIDVGKGEIDEGGRVVEIEGEEGKEMMIESVRELRKEGRI